MPRKKVSRPRASHRRSTIRNLGDAYRDIVVSIFSDEIHDIIRQLGPDATIRQIHTSFLAVRPGDTLSESLFRQWLKAAGFATRTTTTFIAPSTPSAPIPTSLAAMVDRIRPAAPRHATRSTPRSDARPIPQPATEPLDQSAEHTGGGNYNMVERSVPAPDDSDRVNFAEVQEPEGNPLSKLIPGGPVTQDGIPLA